MTRTHAGPAMAAVADVCRLLGTVFVVMFAAGCVSATPPPSPPCKTENPPSDGRIALDTSDLKYRAYFAQVRERINAKWVYPTSAGEQGIGGNALIDFDIAKDGHLEYIQLTRSSGTTILDNAALVAVKLAQPFPPVPDSVSPAGLRLRAAFCYIQPSKGVVDRTQRYS
jgi:TonB family protein